MVKIRLPSQTALIDFDSPESAFEWVRKTQFPCILELLVYDHSGSLESMDRYHFDGDRFVRENILS